MVVFFSRPFYAFSVVSPGLVHPIRAISMSAAVSASQSVSGSDEFQLAWVENRFFVCVMRRHDTTRLKTPCPVLGTESWAKQLCWWGLNFYPGRGGSDTKMGQVLVMFGCKWVIKISERISNNNCILHFYTKSVTIPFFICHHWIFRNDKYFDGENKIFLFRISTKTFIIKMRKVWKTFATTLRQK